MPTGLAGLATSRLLSLRGKLRAAVEPLLPRTPTTDDVVGALIRRRFGDEVQERLVDALVGSIYAADTDRLSFSGVPQLAALTADRSLLLGARRRQRRRSRGRWSDLPRAPIGHGRRSSTPSPRPPSPAAW